MCISRKVKRHGTKWISRGQKMNSHWIPIVSLSILARYLFISPPFQGNQFLKTISNRLEWMEIPSRRNT